MINKKAGEQQNGIVHFAALTFSKLKPAAML